LRRNLPGARPDGRCALRCCQPRSRRVARLRAPQASTRMNPTVGHPSDEPREQMLRYLDGTLPADEVERLNRRLRSDLALRREFAEIVLQQVHLGELGREPKLGVALQEIVPLPSEAGPPPLRQQ